MLKRTLYFTQPAYLSVKDQQLFVKQEEEEPKKVPVEDIGFVVIENQRITITMPAIQALVKNNAAVVFCDQTHLPTSMVLNLDGHHLQNELFRAQTEASLPLKKNLWQQTIKAKIQNQALLLEKLNKTSGSIKAYAKQVKSGDSSNREAAASRVYWKQLFGNSFKRERYGSWPNAALNYGYAILRASVARSLSGSGLLSTLGIHHKNRNNPYCLADDIMEPYRPYVDELAFHLYESYPDMKELPVEFKAEILQLLTRDVVFEKIKRPLMVGLMQTTSSLAACFKGEKKKIEYPVLS